MDRFALIKGLKPPQRSENLNLEDYSDNLIAADFQIPATFATVLLCLTRLFVSRIFFHILTPLPSQLLGLEDDDLKFVLSLLGQNKLRVLKFEVRYTSLY